MGEESRNILRKNFELYYASDCVFTRDPFELTDYVDTLTQIRWEAWQSSFEFYEGMTKDDISRIYGDEHATR